MARCCVPSSGGLLKEMFGRAKTRDERTQAINTLVVKQDSGNWGLDMDSAKAQECISLLLCAINCLLPCTAANCICSGIALQAARKIRGPKTCGGVTKSQGRVRCGGNVVVVLLLRCNVDYGVRPLVLSRSYGQSSLHCCEISARHIRACTHLFIYVR